jgi:hypothetical protein
MCGCLNAGHEKDVVVLLIGGRRGRSRRNGRRCRIRVRVGGGASSESAAAGCEGGGYAVAGIAEARAPRRGGVHQGWADLRGEKREAGWAAGGGEG